MKITSFSAEETRRAGKELALQSSPGDVYGLCGALGAGKTEFVRGFVAARANDAAVRSPTFTLINSYETPSFDIHHFDFYRLGSADELHEIGFYEYLDSGGICLIEWADMFPEVLPETARMIRFCEDSAHVRIIEME